MLISLTWLRDYVDFDVDAPRLAHDLTMAGLNVEGVEHRQNPFRDLVIGKVESCERHPNADRLSVCKVDAGEDRLRDVVCGAANVREGLEVAFIRSGYSLPGGMEIRKTKLRGALSEGMICSAAELGLSAEADGIMELESGLPVGTSLSELYGHEDWILDIEVTPNRPDQLGYIGVAREVAALYGSDLKLPETEIPKESLADSAPFPIEVEDQAGCPRYIARFIEEAVIGPSPDWMRLRLESAGLRPINNLVDITNFVMLETGQPLHAFDAELLSGDVIVVRSAGDGEKTRTLDEDDITLKAEDLVIADKERVVALAGVMGCENSMVRDETRTLVLESAYFDPKRVRKTRSRLDLNTDSSYRFERGADIEMVDFASRRAARLLALHAGARVGARETDIGPGAGQPKQLDLRVSSVNRLLGGSMDAAEVGAILDRLGFSCKADGEIVKVGVPSFRRDIEIEVDLIEEVARIHGYENFPAENTVSNQLFASLSEDEKLQSKIHASLVASGCREIQTSSFMDAGRLDDMLLSDDDHRRQVVTVRNPLVSFNEKMRTSLLTGFLDVINLNMRRGNENLRLYQIGRVYYEKGADSLPTEEQRLGVLLTGLRDPEHLSRERAGNDLQDIQAVLVALGGDLGMRFELDFDATDSFFISGAAFRVRSGKVSIGQGGLLKASLLKDLKQKPDVFWLDLSLKALAEAGSGLREQYQPFSAFPSAQRDLALLAPKQTTWREMQDAIWKAGGKLLLECRLFDIYVGDAIPESTKSCAVHLEFGAKDATLTDAQIDKQVGRILKTLKDSLNICLRS